MSDTAFQDPFPNPGRGKPSRLTDVQPEGYEISLNEDGSADVHDPSGPPPLEDAEHFANLALSMEQGRLDAIASELLDAIEQDKESREERDRQYEEGLNRTGMGNNTPGGATFPGASRAVHPLLLESSIDFAAGVMNEMLPPEGPVKATVTGDENDEKAARAKRVARYMNYQITELMPSTYHEFEVGFTQCPLGGAFYTKTYLDNRMPAVSFIPIDHVYRPWSDGDFYSQPRITHAQSIDKWTYKENVRKGLWMDVVDVDTGSSQIPEESKATQANDRIVGRDEPTENVDGIRLVYETSIMMGLLDDYDDMEPLLVTIDVEARKVVAVYRNWRKDDPDKKRIPFLIEWPFWPWRGGYPVGLTHMIGSLTGAATGSLRALLDAAMLNNSQTGVKLKGGSSSGGQNIQPRVTEITEIAGSLAQDDIRKTFMPMEFNAPSPVLFQLLGFLVDAGKGVVRTTFDEYDKFNGETPVGTAQMFIEQGLKNFGSVHARLHRSMRLFLKGLYQINQDTLTDQTIIDQQGELTVSAADFQGPMVVIPISDPRIFSDLQRKAMAQTIAARAEKLPMIYNLRKSEENFLRQYGVADPDQYLVEIPKPKRMNAVAENVTASSGQPLQAFPGQDHEAHITVHVAFLKSKVLGSSISLAPKFIPQIIEHLGQHLALWYSDAMLEAATAALRVKTMNPALTLESFMGEGTEIGLDRLMAELDDEVIAEAQATLGDVPTIIEEARQLLKELAPPMPMDPSVVAQEDVQRQREKDRKDGEIKVIDIKTRRELGMAQIEQKGKETAMEAAFRVREEQRKDDEAEAARIEAEQQAQIESGRVAVAADANQVKLETNNADNQTALDIVEMNNKARVEAAKEAAKGRKAAGGGGGGNIRTGTGINPGPTSS